MTTAFLELDNVTLVRRGYEAFSSGDVGALKELFHEDAVWHGTPTGVLRGTYRGRAAIVDFLGQVQRETAGSFRLKPVAMASEGNRVFVQTESSARRHGQLLRSSDIAVFTIERERVVEVRAYSGDHPAAAAFWR
jgi:ketosteroid isomerase-like protein